MRHDKPIRGSVTRAKTPAAFSEHAGVSAYPRAGEVDPATAHSLRTKRPLDGLHISLNAAAAPPRRREEQRRRGHIRRLGRKKDGDRQEPDETKSPV